MVMTWMDEDVVVGDGNSVTDDSNNDGGGVMDNDG